MVVFARRERLREPVHGRGGRGDDLADAGVRRGFDDVEGSVDEGLEADTGLGRGLGDAHPGLVEHDVDAFHEPVDEIEIADVTLHEPERGRVEPPREVLAPARAEVVEDDDLLDPASNQEVGPRWSNR